MIQGMSIALSLSEIEQWLREQDPGRLKDLWQQADRMRQERVGEDVHLRGLIEISNYCRRSCWYCGLRTERTGLQRYRLTEDEILSSARLARRLGFGTVVMQAGEDQGLACEWISSLIRSIKQQTGLAVTLSLGEQPESVLRAWRQAGADRYLLKIESTDKKLLSRIHPGEPHGSREETLRRAARLGYEIGSGVMVGIPGQTFAMLAQDLQWFKDMDLDMIGIGPYLPHPDTPLAHEPMVADQVPNTEDMTLKAIALTRLLCPDANLPATTALATMDQAQGRELALSRGANVIMPNLTPGKYRAWYEIYPAKACVQETPEECHACLLRRIESLGRRAGKGPGNRKKAG